MYLKIVDFGLVVLIWVVQLVVYPGFYYYEKEALVKWHTRYTRNISLVVMPLMIGQLALHSYWLLKDFNFFRLWIFMMILAAWVVTFLFAVPLHGNISKNKALAGTVESLVKINWIRTILWTLVFVVNFLTHQESP
ncbi:MAG: hypothetical protein MI921_10620 [Cytophagales bacterium]|nr:hypothetical protein [Cytophagales bacterium]